MPGVPSGRGCEACRKQKKKCDQGKPRCGRCNRLNIDCFGSGQRRFKFVEQSQVVVVRPKPEASPNRGHPPGNYQTILWAPSNDATMVLSAFCTALGVRDARYDLSIYGDFMKGIPQRIGSNAALDACVRATTSVYRAVRSQTQTVESLEDYGNALTALGKTLNDPKQARTANTLCAMYLIMVCQGWVGQENDCTGHGQAFAYILSSVEIDEIQDTFENELFVTLCVPVIVESVGNPRIQLHPWLKKLTERRDQATPFETLKLQNLGKISDFINNPEANLDQMRLIYGSSGEEMIKVRAYLDKILKMDVLDRGVHSRYQTIYSIQLAFVLILNAQLQCFSHNDLATFLIESRALTLEAIALAEDAMQYRPLGSSGVPTCLVCAWASTKEPTLRIRLEEIVTDYQQDFTVSKWMRIATWLERKLKINQIQVLQKSLSLAGQADSPTALDTLCSVM